LRQLNLAIDAPVPARGGRRSRPIGKRLADLLGRTGTGRAAVRVGVFVLLGQQLVVLREIPKRAALVMQL
jgi:hypothetical protein